MLGAKIIKKSFKNNYRIISPLMIILIMLAVFICFFPTLNNDFVWDDEYNLIDNSKYRGLSWSHISWMITTLHDGNYHPLCWLSFGLDFTLWGMNPAGYHLTNLILHGVNAVLFYLLIATILKRLSENPLTDVFSIQTSAAVGALFFALHPLRVESVAWISTRGDTLCGFFFFLTILCYLRIDEDESTNKRNKWLWFSLVFFTFSLLSRAWGITLPVILLILDIYPMRRIVIKEIIEPSGRKILAEKIPFVLIAFSAGILAFLAKKGSMIAITEHTMIDRFFQAAYGLCFYLWKSIAPIKLSPFYLLHNFNASNPKYIMCAIAIFCITIVLIILRHRWPWAITSWICYVIIVSPLLGFVQSGPQVVADRYTYFSCLPFGVLAGAGVHNLALAYQTNRMTRWVWMSIVVSISAGLLLMGILSFCQTGVWRNNLSFWNKIISLDSNNYIAVNERARLKFEEIGDLYGAEVDYSHALLLNPENADAMVSRGLVQMKMGNFTGALKDFNAAAGIDPKKADIYNGLGLLHYEQGLMMKALQHYNTAIMLNPKFADAFNNRGLLQMKLGKLTAAIEDYNKAIILAPKSPGAYVNRGVIFQSQNDLEQAARDFAIALDLAPANWSFRKRVEQTLVNIHESVD